MQADLDCVDVGWDRGRCVCVGLRGDDSALLGAYNLGELESLAPKFRIDSSGDSGVGIYAEGGFATGDLIWRERPLILIPSRPFPNIFVNIQTRLHPEELDTVMSLRNAHPCKVDAFEGTLRTNFIGVELSAGYDASYRALFPMISRANHCCSSNATYRFDTDSFALELRAVRAITYNEQVCVQYIDVLRPRRERKRILRELYWFGCLCPSCALPDESRAAAESDHRRHLIKAWSENHTTLETWLYDRSLPEDLVEKDSVELLEILRLEGLECMERFALDTLCAALAASAKETAFRTWALWAREAARIGGEWHPMVLYYDRTLDDPQSSPLWNARELFNP
ncbi:hypothetical protein BS47DRAFT_1094208 [Hydnum rufescens UP504]|uniref:SET domain-containing protein n=1 Tax=Hydnum rufescens UP504 TaxID=1448309 RepID=A0A9P6AUD6_9AGAM|nr:hypothetical protein BS47DRAFT_1094208 [Hydnum rufescens UP504]